MPVLFLAVLVLLEAFAAIYGTIVARLEWDLCRFPAIGANSIKHFALTATLRFSCRPAGLAADRLILKAFLRVELLLASGKNKLITAILAHQSLVFEHFLLFPFSFIACVIRLAYATADLVFSPTPANWESRS